MGDIADMIMEGNYDGDDFYDYPAIPERFRINCRDCGKRIWMNPPTAKRKGWAPQEHDCDKSELVALLPDDSCQFCKGPMFWREVEPDIEVGFQFPETQLQCDNCGACGPLHPTV